MCRTNLQVIKQFRKDPVVVESLAAKWAADSTPDPRLDEKDWRVALVRNRPRIVKLMHLYAAK